MEIKFTSRERNEVLEEANRRQQVNEAKGLSGRNGGPATGELALKYHKLGCAGEMAVAIYLGMKDFLWLDKTPHKGSWDLPFFIDVKTRTHHWHDLIVQKDDTPGKNYWLVIIENKKIFLKGWIYGHEAFEDEYIKDPAGGRSAYFIPQHVLREPESFYNHFEKSTLSRRASMLRS